MNDARLRVPGGVLPRPPKMAPGVRKPRESWSRASLGSFLAERRRLLVLSALVVGVVAVFTAGDYGSGENAAEALAVALDPEVLVDPEGTFFWGEQGPTSFSPVLFRGRLDPEAPADLYYAEARLGDAGDVIATRRLTNITRTSSADERAPIAVGSHHVAYLSEVDGRTDAVTLLDLRGEPASATAGWPRRARWQNRVTNLQEYGRTVGFGRQRYALRPPAEEGALRVEGERVVLLADGERVVIEQGRDEPFEGGARVELRPDVKGMPGTLTWVVDSVRNLSFVGPEPIAWLELRVFSLKDALQRGWYAMVGGPDTEAEVAEEMGIGPQTAEETRRRAELSITDPELGWPPAALTPVVRQPAGGEGEWSPVTDDPFVRSYPGAPPAFYTTFLQVDPDRPFTRVYVVVWDPRALQLRVMTGTREPESATGETGTGLVPRDPDTLRRVVAGFNGGFQSLHGEFGMMAEGRVYLPPKPWAATVAVFADGHVAMGSWLDPPEGQRFYQERWAVRQIPDDMVEFRQNLTSVVEDGQFNPWRRWYWGAAPADDEEQAYIDRSGMCLTSEGFMAYFWGKSMGADELGEAMLAARCVRGLHLDMNQRHTGFEFYNVMPRAEAQAAPVGRRLREGMEFEIDVPQASGWRARGRLLASSMTPMSFPRYIRRDPRDFFYLTLRPVLPGPALEGADEEENFSSDGLPHAGWPHAFARAHLGPEEARTWLVRIDPRRATPGPLSDSGSARPLAYLTHASNLLEGARAIYAEQELVGRRYGVGRPPADARVVLAGAPLESTPAAGAALGVDADGFLVYAEGPALLERMARAGVPEAVALPDDARLAFQLEEDLTAGPDAYERAVERESALTFLAVERPASEVLFPDVAPRPYMYWGRMQDTRVRYTHGEGPRRFVAPDPEDEEEGTSEP